MDFKRVFPPADEGSNPPAHGIGGYDLSRPTDRAFAFDYESASTLDHIVLYRPGEHICWIVGRGQGKFIRRFPQDDSAPHNGIGGYDLDTNADKAFAVDFDSSGKQDHIVLYRPGTGIIWVVRRARDNAGNPTSPASFVRVYPHPSEGSDPTTRGIGGYSLDDPTDRVFPYDYDHSKKQNHLVLYRRSSANICWIVKPKPGASEFEHVYRAWQHLI